MSVDLTPRTKEVIAQLFDSSIISEVERLLADECGSNLPLYKPATPEGLERIRLALLKISNGDINKLLKAISLAKRDWRDILVWAGFANDLNAHEEWAGGLE
jgi:hypothetical protein